MEYEFEDVIVKMNGGNRSRDLRQSTSSSSSVSNTKSQEKRLHFKYKFVKGFSEKSFGINVATMAQIEDSIIEIARQKESEINSENENLGRVLSITKKFNAMIQPFIVSTASDTDSLDKLLGSIRI